MPHFCLLVGCLFFVVCSAKSDVLVDLYESSLLVPDRERATFERATMEGLSKVLVRLSGDRDVLKLPHIEQVLEKATSLVIRYRYSDENDSDVLRLKIEFDKDEVLREAAKGGIPIWTANRSPVMVLLVIQGNESRMFLNIDANQNLLEALKASFSDRGVPLRLPLLDLTDRLAISEDAIWDKKYEPFLHVFERYGIEDVLVGRLSQLSMRNWVGEWLYKDHEKIVSRYVEALNAQLLFSDGADLVAKTMAARFSVRSGGRKKSNGAILQVVGIDNFSDYVEIVTWLESLEIIEHANLERIEDHMFEFRLISVASEEELSKLVNLNSNLLPIKSNDNFGRLAYKWYTWNTFRP